MIAAEGLAFLEEQEVDIRPALRQGERDKAAGQAATRDHEGRGPGHATRNPVRAMDRPGGWR